MIEIPLRQQVDDDFGKGIYSVIQLMVELNSHKSQNKIILNYSDAKFTHPFFTMPMLLLAKSLNSHYGYNISVASEDFKNTFVDGYMRTIGFPNFINCEEMGLEKVIEVLKKFRNKTYLPLIQFPIGNDQQTTQVRDELIQHVNNLICEITNINKYPGLKSPILYFVDELLSNIVHHAHLDHGYITVQHYPKKGYVDICIGDLGRTILESYQQFEDNKYNVLDHRQAMELSIKGKSTKGGVDRGYGISTSIAMLCKGLGGKFFLFSGDTFTFQDSDTSDIVVSGVEHVFWKGVLICLRIPCDVPDGFRYLNYLE